MASEDWDQSIFGTFDKFRNLPRTSNKQLWALLDTFHNLSLSDCSDVADYAQKLKRANYDIGSLHEEARSPDWLLFTYCLRGLGAKYRFFEAFVVSHYAFYHSNVCFTPERVPHLTFDKLVTLAVKEEERLAIEDNLLKSIVACGPGGYFHEGIIVSQKPTCSRCNNKPGHTVANCWVLHPELKRGKKRTRGSEESPEPATTKRVQRDPTGTTTEQVALQLQTPESSSDALHPASSSYLDSNAESGSDTESEDSEALTSTSFDRRSSAPSC